MRIYRVKPDWDRFTAFACDHTPDIRIFNGFDGTPLRSSWHRVAVSPITDEFPESSAIGDLSQVGIVPVLSNRAVEVLDELLTRDGELLELSTSGGQYFAFNITRIVPALDRPNTVAEWLTEDRIMMEDRLAFHDGLLEGCGFFRIPELQGTSFMTEIVAERVRRTGLTGFALLPVWPD